MPESGPGPVLPPATTGVPEPIPEPPPREEEPIAPLAEIAIDGKWSIRGYTIDLAPPEGAWFFSYHDAFGLELAFGTPRRFERHSTIQLRTNCEGGCDPGTFEARIQNEKASSLYEFINAPKKEWVQRPTELREGVWWMHLRGMNEDGAITSENIDVALMDPKSDGGWVECVLRLQGPELARVDELRQWCEALRVSWAPEVIEPIDARFGGRYHVGTGWVTLPTIAGFRLGEYAALQGIVRLESESRNLDRFDVQSSCQGTCAPHLLQANLEKHVAERIAQEGEHGPRFTVEVPLQSPSPGFYRLRLRSSFGGQSTLDIDVTRIRPGDDHMTECSVSLHGASIARADELEAVCTKALESMQ